MKVIIKNNKLVIITEPTTIKHQIGFVIKYSKFLAQHTIKNKISQILSKYKHGKGIHEHGNQ